MALNPIFKKASRAAIWSRLGAKFIDIFVASLIAMLAGRVGILLGTCYLALADGLQNGQSVGKKALGIGVVLETTGEPCDFKHSAIRNIPFLIFCCPMIIPGLGIWISFIAGIPCLLLELYFILALDSGRRIGDNLADTTVTRCDPLTLPSNADNNS